MNDRVPVVSRWLRLRERAKRRSMMRGYRLLKATGRLDLLTNAVDDMTNTPPCGGATYSRWVFGAGSDRADLVVRQYALVRVTRLSLNKSLLLSLGRRQPVVHPLPAVWRSILTRHGFAVDQLRSALLWQGFVALMWAYGVMSIAQKLGRNLLGAFRGGDSRAHLGAFAFFDALAPGNLPQPGLDGRSEDICSWYARWDDRPDGLAAICHTVPAAGTSTANGVPVVPVPGAVPALTSTAGQARFWGWSVVAVAIATADLFRGRWWHALVLSQASMAATVRLLPQRDVARDYLFHMAAHIYRPLWTYEAESRGARVILYNYSTNIETFKRADGYPTQANSWQVTTWPICLVWDDAQAEFFARMTGGRTSIRVVGPIWFSTSPLMLGAVPTPAVAVFDVQPHRASWYQLLGMGDEFYTPSTVNQFLLDAHRAVGEAGATMILKRKRDIGRQQHPSYAAVGRRLEKAGHFLAVDPSIAATKVIAESRAVISLPFTSTALLGRAMGKPSVYYDPLGTVQRDDRAAHGVPVVIGYEELARWVAANV